MKVLVAQSCPTLCNSMDNSGSDSSPLSMGFLRQEYWTGLPFASPGDLPGPGLEPTSPAFAGRLFTTGPPGKPTVCKKRIKTHFKFTRSFQV